MALERSRFGNVVPRSQSAGTGPVNKSYQVLEKAGKLLGTVADMSQKAAKTAERLELANKSIEYVNQSSEVYRNNELALKEGRIAPEEAEKYLEESNEAVRMFLFDEVRGDSRSILDAHAQKVDSRNKARLDRVVLKMQQDIISEKLDGMLGSATTMAMNTGEPDRAWSLFETSVNETAELAGLDRVTYLKEKKGDFLYQTHAHAMNEARAQGDTAGLARLREWLKSDAAEAMDPKRRIQLANQALAHEKAIAGGKTREVKRAKRAVSAKNRQAGKDLSRAKKLQNNGKLKEAHLSAMAEALSGTPYEAQLKGLIESQEKLNSFMQLNRSERAKALERNKKPSARQPGGESSRIQPGAARQADDSGIDFAAATEADIQLANLFATIERDNAVSPWASAASRGVFEEEAAFNPQQPEEWLEKLEDRVSRIAELEDWVGNPVSPFDSHEATLLASQLAMLPPQNQAEVIDTLVDSIGDSDRIGVLAQQLAGEQPAFGQALALAAGGHPLARAASQRVLQGVQVLKKMKAEEAAEKRMHPAIAKRLAQVYPDKPLREARVQAASLIHASLEADGHSSIDRAILLATGGLYRHNGRDIPLPHGYTAASFAAQLARLTPADVLGDEKADAATTIRMGRFEVDLKTFLAQLPAMKLAPVDDGRYRIDSAFMRPVRPDGSEIIIDLTRLA